MSEYIITVDENDERWHYVVQQYTHFFGYPIAEEIVRCRDCKWLDHHNLCLCMLPDGDGGYACWVVEPDGFCAWGEQRGE